MPFLISPMIKLFALPVFTTLASFFLLPELAIAVPKASDWFCYQQRANGQIVDLRSMCRQNPSLQKVTKNATPSAAKANALNKKVIIKSEASRVLEFIEQNYDGFTLVGIIKNKTNKPISNVRISYLVYTKEADSSLKLIDSGFAIADNQVLEKGEKSSFSVKLTTKGEMITITKVETE